MDQEAKEAYAKEYVANKRRQLKVNPKKVAIAGIAAIFLLPLMYFVVTAGLKNYGSQFIQILFLVVLLVGMAFDQVRKK